RAGAPANIAIRPPHAEFGLKCIVMLGNLTESPLQEFEIFFIYERAHAIQRRNKGARLDTEYFALALIPSDGTARDVPLPTPHLPGCQRKTAEALALAKLPCRSRKRRGSFGDARL